MLAALEIAVSRCTCQTALGSLVNRTASSCIYGGAGLPTPNPPYGAYPMLLTLRLSRRTLQRPARVRRQVYDLRRVCLRYRSPRFSVVGTS